MPVLAGRLVITLKRFLVGEFQLNLNTLAQMAHSIPIINDTSVT